MCVLPDHLLAQLCHNEKLVVPFDTEALQPASIDLRLGSHIKVWATQQARQFIQIGNKGAPSLTEGYVGGGRDLDPRLGVMPDDMMDIVIPDGDHFHLLPGRFVLGSTEEVISIPDLYVARLEGKSSLGRMGLSVHSTAGYIDPGFVGRVTLELKNDGPRSILLTPGIFIAQLSVLTLCSAPVNSYQGHYQNQETTTAAVGQGVKA